MAPSFPQPAQLRSVGLAPFFCLAAVRRKRSDSVPVSRMWARSVMRPSSALHKRALGMTWVHSENGKVGGQHHGGFLGSFGYDREQKLGADLGQQQRFQQVSHRGGIRTAAGQRGFDGLLHLPLPLPLRQLQQLDHLPGAAPSGLPTCGRSWAPTVLVEPPSEGPNVGTPLHPPERCRAPATRRAAIAIHGSLDPILILEFRAKF